MFLSLSPYHFQEVTKLAAQVRQLYGSNMKSVSPVHLHLTGLVTGSRIYLECVRQSLDFSKLMVSEPGPHTTYVYEQLPVVNVINLSTSLGI